MIFFIFKYLCGVLCGNVVFVYQQKPTIFTKQPSVTTTVPSDTQQYPWGTGILGYTFGYVIQAQTISPPCWGSCSPSDYK